MKLVILCLDVANKLSPMSDGVAEIQMKNQPCKGINQTTWRTQARKAPWVATMHDMTKEMIRAHLTLVHVFHTYASMDTSWVAHALSRCTLVRYGRIAFVSMGHAATQFGDFLCPVCVNTFQLFVHLDPTDAGLNWHRRGLWPWSSKFQIRALPFLPIQYSPLSPNCPT
jgi:hypothetical protein